MEMGVFEKEDLQVYRCQGRGGGDKHNTVAYLTPGVLLAASNLTGIPVGETQRLKVVHKFSVAVYSR